MDGFARAASSFIPWIDQRDAAGLKITDVSGDYGQAMNKRCGSDQGVAFICSIRNVQAGTAQCHGGIN